MFLGQDAISIANRHFYLALSLADPDAMRQIWHKSEAANWDIRPRQPTLDPDF
jgi:hypothetical protein